MPLGSYCFYKGGLLLLYEKLNITSPAAQIILSVAIIMLSGFLMTRITKKLRLPNVTAYLLTGILLGPFCFNVIPQNFIGGTEFLSDIALAFISFGTGEFFKFASLKKNGAKVIVITLFEACFAFILVFFILSTVLKVEFAFSIVLSALAAATAPASTLMTIRQTRAKGDFVDTLLQVIALDNVISLFAYSIAISLAVAAAAGTAIMPASIISPIVKNIGALLLGGLFGGVMCLLIRKKRSDDNRLIIAVALLFAFCGICTVMDISPLLGCMSMGMIYSNMSKDDKLFKQLNYFNPPFMLLFFVRSGLSFDISALLDSGAGFGGVSLLAIGLLYFAVRMIGKYAGAFVGSVVVRKSSS
ncbi:MAG: cation:proton antiporter, partial [Clostridia bacterium]|nr:cation:proton antiporter [Clostridia bacterium]